MPTQYSPARHSFKCRRNQRRSGAIRPPTYGRTVNRQQSLKALFVAIWSGVDSISLVERAKGDDRRRDGRGVVDSPLTSYPQTLRC